jgi:6-phosphogluconolactonase
MSIIEHNYESVETLNEQFAQQVAQLLAQGILENGNASLVVSGGRTPAAMFNTLSLQDIKWENVDVTLADERWVNEDDPASNAAMVKRELLINNAQKATFYGLKTSHQDASEAIDTLNQQLSQISTPFDVLILGMGEDGHTASLFPCSAQIKQGLDTSNTSDYIAVTPNTAPNQRMSLTLKRILDSKKVFLHLTGDTKKAVLHKALESDNALEMPIRAVLNKIDVNLVWAP